MRPHGTRLPFRRPNPNHSEVGRQSTFSAPLPGRRHKWAQWRHFRRGTMSGASSWPAGARASSAPSQPIGALERKWGHTIGAQLGRVLFSFYFIRRQLGGQLGVFELVRRCSLAGTRLAPLGVRAGASGREWGRSLSLGPAANWPRASLHTLPPSVHTFGIALGPHWTAADCTLQAAHCKLLTASCTQTQTASGHRWALMAPRPFPAHFRRPMVSGGR